MFTVFTNLYVRIPCRVILLLLNGEIRARTIDVDLKRTNIGVLLYLLSRCVWFFRKFYRITKLYHGNRATSNAK